MAHQIVLGATSTSSTVFDKKELGAVNHFKWDCIRNFLYLAEAFSSIHVTFDLFSGVTTDLSIYVFVIFAFLIGMPYLCMDFFIKQYTGKLDYNEALNPLLKGINYGIMCVSAMHALVHAKDLADSIYFFLITLNPIPQWSECSPTFMKYSNNKCIPTKNITILCSKQDTDIKTLSTHINYQILFVETDRSIVTKKLFILAVLWIANFFISTVSDHMLVKFFYLSFMLRNISTVIATIFVVISAEEQLDSAVQDVMAFKFHITTVKGVTATSVLYIYGIGIVGVYDFGTLSPQTIVDNAVVIFTIVFILMSFLRALLVRILFRVMKKCVRVHSRKYQYFLFGTMPLSADFIFSQRLFTIYLYVNLTMGLCTHLAALTAALTKLLHSQFRTIKCIYITGLLCFLGFMLSFPLGLYQVYLPSILLGLNNAMILMAFLKTTIVMYLYGVQKFSTDVHFWLNYKPTKYWTLTWSLMPVFFCWFVVSRVIELINQTTARFSEMILTLVIIMIIVSFMCLIQIRTIVKFIAENNLTALFKSSNRYGPPDGEERKKRRRYDEALSVRRCTHNCVILDDRFDCNHMPLTFKQVPESNEENDSTPALASDQSVLHQLFVTSIKKARVSSVFDADQYQA